MERNKKISEAELEVMKVLWENKDAMTGSEIVTQLKKRADWEDSTIYTLIRRLTKKGALHQEKQGIFFYSPAVSEDSYQMEQAKEFLDKVFGGDARTLVSTLVRHQELQKGDIDELKKFWNDGEGKRE